MIESKNTDDSGSQLSPIGWMALIIFIVMPVAGLLGFAVVRG